MAQQKIYHALVMLLLAVPCSWCVLDGCVDMSTSSRLGTVFSIINGPRIDCFARETSNLNKVKDVYTLMVYPSKECYPINGRLCNPYWESNEGLFADPLFYSAQSYRCPSSDCHYTFTNSHIQLTFHPNAKDLVNQVVNDAVDGPGFNNGYLYNTIDDPMFLDDMSVILGIDRSLLSREDIGFVLARYPKNLVDSYTIDENSVTLNNDFVNGFIDSLSSASTSDDVLRLFSEYGTHYVKGMEIFDYMLQVFVFSRDDYEYVASSYPDDQAHRNGPNSGQFLDYAKPKANEGKSMQIGRLKMFVDQYMDSCIKKYLKDTANGLSAGSIFKFADDRTLQYKSGCMFTQNSVMKLQIGSVSELLLANYPQLKSKWEEILHLAMTQRYGEDISVTLPDKRSEIGLVSQSISLYFNPNLVTKTGTQYTTFTQMNLNFQNLVISNPTFIDYLFIYADTLELDAYTHYALPGSNTIYLICRKFVSASSTNNVPSLIVKSKEVIVAAETIIGTFQIVFETDNPRTHTYTNDYVYKTVDDGIIQTLGGKTVVTDSVLRNFYPSYSSLPQLYTDSATLGDYLVRSFDQSMDLALLTVENIVSLGAYSDPENVGLAIDINQWIINTLRPPASSWPLSSDLGSVLTRALLIEKSRLPFYLNAVVYVPKLTYEFHKSMYNELFRLEQIYQNDLDRLTNEIESRKISEEVSTTYSDLREHIEDLGGYLVAEVEANAQYQEDMSEYYSTIVEYNNNEIDDREAQSIELSAELTELKKSSDYTGSLFKDCVESETIRTIVYAIVDVVSLLFSFPPSKPEVPNDISGVNLVASKVKYALDVIVAVKDIYDKLREFKLDMETVARLADGIPTVTNIDLADFPTKLEWEDFSIEVDQYTSPSTVPPACHGQAADFRADAKKVVARGKLFCDIMKEIEVLQFEIINLELQKYTAERQKERLNDLSLTFSSQTPIPDEVINSTDLNEIGAILQLQQNEVRMELASTYISMDASLQHFYLQEPSPFVGYDVHAIAQAAIRLMQSSQSALLRFPTVPTPLLTPIIFTLTDVSVEDLKSESGANITIDISNPVLSPYLRIRVEEVRVFIDGAVSTSSGKLYVETIANGNFTDRGLGREERHFVSTPVNFPFVYFLADGSIDSSNRPADQFKNDFMQITPFTTWNMRVPPKHYFNQNVQFAGATVTIQLQLFLNVVFD